MAVGGFPFVPDALEDVALFSVSPLVLGWVPLRSPTGLLSGGPIVGVVDGVTSIGSPPGGASDDEAEVEGRIGIDLWIPVPCPSSGVKGLLGSASAADAMLEIKTE